MGRRAIETIETMANLALEAHGTLPQSASSNALVPPALRRKCYTRGYVLIGLSA